MSRSSPPDPDARRTPYATSPGAHKENQRRRSYRRFARRGSRHSGSGPPYAELRAASAFSFLEASSQPEDLMERAAELGLPAVALVDRNGVYGAPRFHAASKASGVRALVGADVALETPFPAGRSPAGGRGGGPRGLVGEATAGAAQGAEGAEGRDDAETRLTLLVEHRDGYRNLCRLLTDAALAGPGGRPREKGQARASWDGVAEHAAGLHCLTGGADGPLARALTSGGTDAARRLLERLAVLFPGRLHVELQRHHQRHEEHRNRALIELAGSLGLPLVATNGVAYARPRHKPLQDVLACIRHGTRLDRAGTLLERHRERHLKGAEEMAALFTDVPRAVAASAELAERLGFGLADLGYRFPEFDLPPGETRDSWLRHLTWNGARARFRPLTGRAQAQIEKELALIEKLELAGYFLIVWDIVRFCQERGILVQGRGSAANSAVCYALSITAVDPVKMDLLFERFLSEERGEWPDIDLDLPSGDRREEVIQYVYRTYGERGAAMTANVITYRDRSAAREVGKALGYSEEQIGALSKTLRGWSRDRSRGEERDLEGELRGAGFDPTDPRMGLFLQLWEQIQHTPRHLGQHSGGMVIAAGRLDEVVPLEPAAMEGRVVVQWDKDDCAGLGVIKVDLLGLGMLDALEEAVPLVREKEGVDLDLAHLPPDDPTTYAMLRRADTVGVFQVESRAQMASLPKNRPERFYDLVIQVAIIRPGPIAGGLAHPYFERRQGRAPVTYPHPSMEPILERTLGVPIFQEQILKIAMVTAGFSGGEAEQLRRAMGSKRSVEKMDRLLGRLRSGMAERGIGTEAQDEIVRAITSFALYGFPESHAASFALIAYASAYLKAHHPTAFTLSLLNAWPMGFYHPSSLIRDAARHGVQVRPIDVQRSAVRCTWEEPDEEVGDDGGNGNGDGERPGAVLDALAPAGAIRLGLRFVRGLRREAAAAIERARRDGGPFASPEDLARRAGLRDEELSTLASIGALASFGLTRRQALWQAGRIGRPSGPLFENEPDRTPSPLPEMTPVEETLADHEGAAVTVGPHPVSHLRDELTRRNVAPIATLTGDAATGDGSRGGGRRNARGPRDGQRVVVAGTVIVRQRPGTAKGVLFLTLEDETGMIQAIVSPELFRDHRTLILGAPGLVVEGHLQHRDGAVSIGAEKFFPLPSVPAVESHDFR